MNSKSASSKSFDALLAVVAEAPARKKPLPYPIKNKAVAPDVKALLDAWTTHRPVRVTVGDFEITDDSLGQPVPQSDDVEQERPPRDDAFGIGVTGGGDIIAVQRDTRGVFSSVVRVFHDRGWSLKPLRQSLTAFVTSAQRAAVANEDTSTLTEYLEEQKRKAAAAKTKPATGKVEIVPVSPKPKRPKAALAVYDEPDLQRLRKADPKLFLYPTVPLRLGHGDAQLSVYGKGAPKRLKLWRTNSVTLSPDRHQALLINSDAVYRFDAKTGDLHTLVKGSAFVDAVFLDGGIVAVLRNEDSDRVLAGPEGHQLWLVPSKKRGATQKFQLDADWLSATADGKLLAAGTYTDTAKRVHKSRKPRTQIFRYSDGELDELAVAKRSLQAIYQEMFERDGHWYSPLGYEVRGLQTALQQAKKADKVLPKAR